MAQWLSSIEAPLNFPQVRLSQLRFGINSTYYDTLRPIVHLPTVLDKLQQRTFAALHQIADPRLAPSQGIAAVLYANSMMLPDEGARPYYSLDMPPHILYSVLKFRLGTHHLPVRLLRHTRVHGQPIPRGQRICNKCNSGIVGDEQHLVFECLHLADLRAHYHDLFRPNMTMREFFGQTRQFAVARFIHNAMYIMQ